MNDKEFQSLYARLVSGAEAIIDGKHHDYADTDRLSAFKKVSELWSKLTGKSMYPFEAALSGIAQTRAIRESVREMR